MNYTREQALEVFLDYRKYHELTDELHESEIEFLNAKFHTIEVVKWYKYKEYSDCSNPIHDKIEALERELAELKQLINQ